MRRALTLSLAFAVALMAAFAATWLGLARHWSPAVTLSVLLIGFSGLCGGLVCAPILAWAPVRAATARFALAAILLLCVTMAVLTLGIAIFDMILSPVPLPDDPKHLLVWFLVTTAASFYLVLGVAARLLLPAGLVLVPLFSWVFARPLR